METLSTPFSLRVNPLKERIRSYRKILSFKSRPYLENTFLYGKAERKSQKLFSFFKTNDKRGPIFPHKSGLTWRRLYASLFLKICLLQQSVRPGYAPGIWRGYIYIKAHTDENGYFAKHHFLDLSATTCDFYIQVPSLVTFRSKNHHL